MLLTILRESKGTQKQNYTLRENTKLVPGKVVCNEDVRPCGWRELLTRPWEVAESKSE